MVEQQRATMVNFPNTQQSILNPKLYRPGSGLKLNISSNLHSLSLKLGPLTTDKATLAVSLGDSFQFNYITCSPTSVVEVFSSPSTPSDASTDTSTILTIISPHWINNRIQIEDIILNSNSNSNSSLIEPYIPSPLVFEFIGDSLTSGFKVPYEAVQSYAALTGMHFKAEYNLVGLICMYELHQH
jgi:hypothetical protein